jgi:hypothetical protein
MRSIRACSRERVGMKSAAPQGCATGCIRQANVVGRERPQQVFPIVVWAEVRAAVVFGPAPVWEAGIDHESDQVKQEHSVDALALRGDEGRGTLR